MIDCSLQQKPVGQTGTNYPYKAYIATLLSTRKIEKVIKDNAGVDDPDVKSGMNTGLYLSGRMSEMEGPVHIDIFQQNRLMLNGVSLALKLWPSTDAFRLITNEEDASYETQILDVSFKLCVQKPNPCGLIAHTNMIKELPAIYPYMNSTLAVASISKGEYGHSENNLFQGEIPSQLILTLMESNSFGGLYKKNPFFFQPFNCNFLSLYIDEQSYPAKPLQPTFTDNNYVEAYRNIKACRNNIDISLLEFKRGFTIFVFDIDDNIDFNTKRRGDCRLELRFGSALPENITLLLYGKFPKVLQVDESRRVYLQ